MAYASSTIDSHHKNYVEILNSAIAHLEKPIHGYTPIIPLISIPPPDLSDLQMALFEHQLAWQATPFHQIEERSYVVNEPRELTHLYLTYETEDKETRNKDIHWLIKQLSFFLLNITITPINDLGITESVAKMLSRKTARIAPEKLTNPPEKFLFYLLEQSVLSLLEKYKCPINCSDILLTTQEETGPKIAPYEYSDSTNPQPAAKSTINPRHVYEYEGGETSSAPAASAPAAKPKLNTGYIEKEFVFTVRAEFEYIKSLTAETKFFNNELDFLILFHFVYHVLCYQYCGPDKIGGNFNQNRNKDSRLLRFVIFYIYLLAKQTRIICPQAIILYNWFRNNGLKHHYDTKSIVYWYGLITHCDNSRDSSLLKGAFFHVELNSITKKMLPCAVSTKDFYSSSASPLSIEGNWREEICTETFNILCTGAGDLYIKDRSGDINKIFMVACENLDSTFNCFLIAKILFYCKNTPCMQAINFCYHALNSALAFSIIWFSTLKSDFFAKYLLPLLSCIIPHDDSRYPMLNNYPAFAMARKKALKTIPSKKIVTPQIKRKNSLAEIELDEPSIKRKSSEDISLITEELARADANFPKLPNKSHTSTPTDFHIKFAHWLMLTIIDKLTPNFFVYNRETAKDLLVRLYYADSEAKTFKEYLDQSPEATLKSLNTLTNVAAGRSRPSSMTTNRSAGNSSRKSKTEYDADGYAQITSE